MGLCGNFYCCVVLRRITMRIRTRFIVQIAAACVSVLLIGRMLVPLTQRLETQAIETPATPRGQSVTGLGRPQRTARARLRKPKGKGKALEKTGQGLAVVTQQFDSYQKQDASPVACSSLPECEAASVLNKKWGVTAEQYNYTTCCNSHQQMKEQITELVPFLEQNNITYYLDGGTLIGIERHKSLIPWDHDMDLNVLLESPNPNRAAAYHALKELLYSYNKDKSRRFVMKKCKEWKSRAATALLGLESHKYGVCETGIKFHHKGMTTSSAWVLGSSFCCAHSF